VSWNEMIQTSKTWNTWVLSNPNKWVWQMQG
jgi:hypothetical protein